MSINADISAAITSLEPMFGETVTIDSWTGTALVSRGGDLTFEAVPGGIYDGSLFTVIVRKDALTEGLIPAPPMAVTVRGYSLRIAPDGVTDYRAHYRISVTAKDVPSSR